MQALMGSRRNGAGFGRTAVADVAYTVVQTDTTVVYTSLSAARIVTLPAANTFAAGRSLMIVDGSGSADQTKKISLAPNGTDTIAGSNTTQVAINLPRGRCWLVSNGSTGWDVLAWSVIHTNVLGADVDIDNSGNYFDGPSCSNDHVGVWECSGQVYAGDTGAQVNIVTKLWDGTGSPVATANSITAGAGSFRSVPVSGIVNAPAGNIRLSVRTFTTAGKIKANSMGFSVDSVLKVTRVA